MHCNGNSLSLSQLACFVFLARQLQNFRLLPQMNHINRSDKSSDISLVELENRMVKEDDRNALLEGVVLQAASPASHSSSIESPVVRLFTMDESFLLENR